MGAGSKEIERGEEIKCISVFCCIHVQYFVVSVR